MTKPDSNPSKVKFTAARVRDFSCPDGKRDATLWDSQTAGLGLRVTEGGSRSYIFMFRIHGKAARYRIGGAEHWDIDQAQSEARRLRVLVDQGIDPREEKQAKAEAHAARQAEQARKGLTLGSVWPAYVADRRGEWSARHAKDHERLIQAPGVPLPRGKGLTKAGPLYALSDVGLSHLTADRIRAWLDTEKKQRPTVTALAYRLLRAFLNWLESRPEYQGIVPQGVTTAVNVRKAVPRTKAKTDALQREQLRPWFESVRRIENPAISAYLQSLLLTGARPNEMRELRWEDVDFRWGSLTIRDKVEGERVIPLTPYVHDLLQKLWRINNTPPTVRRLKTLEGRGETWEPSLWVFSSKTSSTGKLIDPRRQQLKALTAAGLPHITLHGLRRSFGSLSEWCEVPAGVVAQIMGHKPSATAEKHYRVRPLDLLRMWHTKVEAWIVEQAGLASPVPSEERGLRLVTPGSGGV